jgi:hypothetical protein
LSGRLLAFIHEVGAELPDTLKKVIPRGMRRNKHNNIAAFSDKTSDPSILNSFGSRLPGFVHCETALRFSWRTSEKYI